VNGFPASSQAIQGKTNLLVASMSDAVGTDGFLFSSQFTAISGSPRMSKSQVSLATPNLAATATAATPDGALQARLADLDNIVFDIACNKYHKDASKPESWCPYAQTTGIRAHGTAGDEAYLTTTLGKTQAPLARDACQTLWNWATNFDPATKQVSVLSSDGQVLANGVIGSKPCS